MSHSSRISGAFFVCLRDVLLDEMGTVYFERFLGRLPVVERMLLMDDMAEDEPISARHLSVIFAAMDLVDLPHGFARMIGIRCIEELCSEPVCEENPLSMETVVSKISEYMEPFVYDLREAPHGYVFTISQRPVYLPLFCRFIEGLLIGAGQQVGHDYVSCVEVECGLTGSEDPVCLFEVGTYEEEYEI